MSETEPIDSIAVLGFGLIGASIAAAFKSRAAAAHVLAVDHAPRLAGAAAQRWSDERIPIDEQESVTRRLTEIQLTILAAPVHVIESQLSWVLPHAPLVTDAGSTKRAVIRAARQCEHFEHFVPGHPMAGRPEAGSEHADPTLFADHPWILCPQGAERGAVERLRAFVAHLGAVVVEMSADEHDRVVALNSHVPRVLASLAYLSAAQGDALATAGPGLASLKRLAGGNPRIWQDIFETNADEIAAALRQFGSALNDVAEALENGDVEPALRALERAKRHIE